MRRTLDLNLDHSRVRMEARSRSPQSSSMKVLFNLNPFSWKPVQPPTGRFPIPTVDDFNNSTGVWPRSDHPPSPRGSVAHHSVPSWRGKRYRSLGWHLTDPIRKYHGLLHRIEIHEYRERRLLLAEVQLFSNSETPSYGVILGQLKETHGTLEPPSRPTNFVADGLAG